MLQDNDKILQILHTFFKEGTDHKTESDGRYDIQQQEYEE